MMLSVFIIGYIFFISDGLNMFASTSKSWAVVACLFNSSKRLVVVATVTAPFCFNPVESSVSFSSCLYKSKEYFLNFVIVAEAPI